MDCMSKTIAGMENEFEISVNGTRIEPEREREDKE